MRLSNAASSRPVSSQVQRSLHTLIKINIRAAVFNGPNLLPLAAGPGFHHADISNFAASIDPDRI